MSEHIKASGQKLSVEHQRKRVLQDFDSIRVLEIDGEPVGMLKIVKKPDQWKLVQIQVLPTFQNRGIGGAMVERLLNDARRECTPVSLSVLKVNPARHLYERLGFRVVTEREYAYDMRVDA